MPGGPAIVDGLDTITEDEDDDVFGLKDMAISNNQTPRKRMDPFVERMKYAKEISAQLRNTEETSPWFMNACDILAVIAQLGQPKNIAGVGRSWRAASLLLSEIISPLTIATLSYDSSFGFLYASLFTNTLNANTNAANHNDDTLYVNNQNANILNTNTNVYTNANVTA
ncbi:hypothetical protein GGI25_004709 [Coemansia spiralis]|uniref:Uncharacterized protein n=1 Tax=Coemansia spiralis TaxID=417178 RepID=A0A9W8G545_9FUNG|nr:hypothetical protein GGI25_004709 [Coemansia spiralis]